MNSEYYYGLPQELWDHLEDQVEEIFREEEIGQQIVGIFPSGERIFGIESAEQQAIVLFVDSIESLLDPAIDEYRQLVTPYVPASNNFLTFIDLKYWVRGLIASRKYSIDFDCVECFTLGAMDYIPIFGDTIYFDESIEKIFVEAERFILSYPRALRHFNSSLSYRGDINILLRRRAEVLFLLTGEYCPCINPEWGITKHFENNSTFDKLDSKIIELLLANNRIDSLLHSEYLDMLYDIEHLVNRTKIMDYSQLRKEVIDFYRFQL
jgi:hypothetical protein